MDPEYLVDPEYVRMVATQFGPRKTVANLCVRPRASEQINSSVWVIFTGKVGSDLGEEKPITSIRWTTQFVRVRRISDLYNPI